MPIDLQAPYLNSVAGTNLDGHGVAETIRILDPLSSFEYNSNYFINKDSIVYFKNAWPAIIKDWSNKGLLPKNAVTVDEFIWASAIWFQMKDYQTKSRGLIAQLERKSLNARKKSLLAKAKQHFEWFNFLDAYRLATAASS